MLVMANNGSQRGIGMASYGKQMKELREAAGIAAVTLAGRMGWSKTRMSERESETQPTSEAEFLRVQAALLDLIAERDAAFAEARARQVAS